MNLLIDSFHNDLVKKQKRDRKNTNTQGNILFVPTQGTRCFKVPVNVSVMLRRL